MKAKTKVRIGVLWACVSAFLALGACAQVAFDTTHSSTQPDPSSFADALSPPGGVPCRMPRPAYTALQRKLGIHGRVHVTYVINTVGRIDLAIVDGSSGNQELDNAARESVVHATCAPYVVDGVAHRVVQNTSFNFEPALEIKPAAQSHAQAASESSSTAQLPAPQAAVADTVKRAAPASAASSPAVSQPVVPATAAPSLAKAIQEAMLQKMGVAPDSPRAAQIKRWNERIVGDPDISRFFGNGPNHASIGSLSPTLRAEFAAEGVLRLSPEQRSTLVEVTLKALDNAPADCGGVKDGALVTARYMPLATMSDAEIDAYYAVSFAMLKQTALQAPLAQVTEEQRAAGAQALGKTMEALLKNDPEGTRAAAAAVVDPAGVSAEVWCRNSRLYNRAVLATPQPMRDWSLVATDTDLRAKLATLSQASMSTGQPVAATALDYATQVQRRVRPNIVWSGPTLNLETGIFVRCAPSGTILSATISRSSGNDAWDMAALRAVQNSDPMPVDATGRAPREFTLTMRPAG
jgi:TonB family protein